VFIALGKGSYLHIFYLDTLRLSGWFGANDDPVHGLWHHVDVGCIVIVLRILSVFKCRQ
jgi:hypothetical protein